MIERYSRAKMKRIWSDQNKFKAWLDVELAAVKAWEELGRIPKGTYDRIQKKAKFTVKGIEDIEKVTNHDVIAFTTDVAKYVGEDSKWIHLGLTSSDVVDTAQALILREAMDEVIAGAILVRNVLKDLALKHKDTIMMGRTHGVHAEPTTFGAKVAVWYAEMSRNLERLQNVRKEISVGKMSGAVGNFAHCPPKLEEIVMRELKLDPAPASSQVIQRDRHAVMMFTLAVLGGTLEKIAVTLRGLQRTEIGEVMESFAKGQKGSSAMPHKRNPITLERITGLARLLRANALAACENQALWDERDISHSSVERVIFADSLTVADYVLDIMAEVLQRLVVDERKMDENMRLTKGVHFSQTVLLKLIDKGLQREKAYEIVQRNAMKTHNEGTPFYDNLLKDEAVMEILDREELAECFSNRHFSHNTSYILYRVGILDSPPVEEAAPVTVSQPHKRTESRDKRRKPSKSAPKAAAVPVSAPKPAVTEQAKRVPEPVRPAPEPVRSSRPSRRAPVRNAKTVKRESEPVKTEERTVSPEPPKSAPQVIMNRRVIETKAYEEHKRQMQAHQSSQRPSAPPPAYERNNRDDRDRLDRNERLDKDERNTEEPLDQEALRRKPNYDADAITEEPIVRSTDADRRRPSDNRSRTQQSRPPRRGRPTSPSSNQPRSNPRPQSPPPPAAPPRRVDEDAQPPQIEDWRNAPSNNNSGSYRGMPDLRSRKKR